MYFYETTTHSFSYLLFFPVLDARLFRVFCLCATRPCASAYVAKRINSTQKQRDRCFSTSLRYKNNTCIEIKYNKINMYALDVEKWYLPARISCRVWLNVWSCLSFTCPLIRRNRDRNPTAAFISGFIVARAQRVCIELRAIGVDSVRPMRFCSRSQNGPCLSRVLFLGCLCWAFICRGGKILRVLLGFWL